MQSEIAHGENIEIKRTELQAIYDQAATAMGDPIKFRNLKLPHLNKMRESIPHAADYQLFQMLNGERPDTSDDFDSPGGEIEAIIRQLPELVEQENKTAS